MEYLQSFLIVVMEMVCFFLFQDAFVPTEKKHKSGFYALWILALSFSALVMSYLFEDSFIVKEIAMIVLFFCSIVLLKRGEKKRAILVAVMFVFLVVIVDLITLLFDTKILKVKNRDDELVAMLVVLMSKAILVMIILLLRKFVAARQDSFQRQTNMLRYAIIPFVSIWLMSIILSNDLGIMTNQMRYAIWGCIFILLIANLLLVFFMKSDAEKNQLLYERKMLELAAAGEKREYKAMEEKLDLQKSLNHDFRNHLNCLQGLVERQNYEEVKAYLAQLNHKYSVEVELIDTHNVIINTVLNDKYNEAKEIGAVIALQIGDLSAVCMEELDIILLLSNLFNNAIEALKECEKQKILRIKLELKRGEFLISVQNSFEGDRKKNGEIYTTTKKKDAELHGYGMKNIRNTAEKYGGFCQFDSLDSEFHAVVCIPMSEKNFVKKGKIM